MLLRGGLLLLERLLVLRVPFRSFRSGEIVRRARDGDLDRESYETGVFERVRSLPRETDREGMVNVGGRWCQFECEMLSEMMFYGTLKRA